ncbi:MAG: hypothetical protein SOW20_08110 [Berryella intestinalis]|uniref:hypothetical protein n=1 Tax=Berryella intestinalis TaxID=1531429 RepID=UPI002A7598B9|nr:hypothetical protein [Berryella intestinalis]MDY3129967.1 hypothetical protein [Berryella intestinalis]
MPTVIKGQSTSPEVIAKLKDEDRPVLLSFSCGKDSIAAWIALEDAGIDVVPVYMYIVPNLPFVEKQLSYFESKFGKRIHRFPHASFYRLVGCGVFQAPERISIIERAQIPVIDYAHIWGAVRDHLGMQDCWVADGVRAADSIVRRASFVKHGVMKKSSMKVSPIADWLKAEVYEAIERRGIDLPIDYEIFGRSFDGIDRRFTEPMREHLPKDYAVLKEWFPMIEADIVRWGSYDMSTSASAGSYTDRAKAERERFELATDSEFWAAFCFKDERDLERFRSMTGISEGFVSGIELRDKTASLKPEKPKRGFAKRCIANPAKENPLDSVEYTDDLEADSRSEAMALYRAFVSGRQMRPVKNAIDSDLWICAAFRSREDKEGYLRDWGLTKYGDKYIDASAWMRSL